MYLQEVLAQGDLGMVKSELLDGLDGLAAVVGVLGHEGLGGDVEGEELGVDGIEDGWDERRDEGRGGDEGLGVGGRDIEELGEVGDARGEVLEGGGLDMLHCGHVDVDVVVVVVEKRMIN